MHTTSTGTCGKVAAGILPAVEPGFKPGGMIYANSEGSEQPEKKGGKMPPFEHFQKLLQAMLEKTEESLRRRVWPNATAKAPKPMTAPVIGTSGTGVV